MTLTLTLLFALRPCETLKQQEKSTEQSDKDAVEKHLKVLEAWGKKHVWQGVPDTLANVMAGAGASKRSGNEKCSKDLKHLSL